MKRQPHDEVNNSLVLNEFLKMSQVELFRFASPNFEGKRDQSFRVAHGDANANGSEVDTGDFALLGRGRRFHERKFLRRRG